MIVPVSSEKYKNLFIEATDFLGLAQPINSLNDYYAHMQEFYARAAQSNNYKGYKYIMMPLADVGAEIFNIDLNTRIISVPKTFAAVGGVQSDQMAEFIVFSADRYFAHMDLSMVDIYVQYQLPDNTSGATRVSIIDIESEPGKIRFAWPLHSAITAQSGIVKFSVRFFSLDGASETMTYSLNTQEAAFPVKPCLNHGKAIVEDQDVTSLYQKAILNSAFTAEGKLPPQIPLFDAPGMDMTIMQGWAPVHYASAQEFAADPREKYNDKYQRVLEFVDDEMTYYVQEQDFVRYMDDPHGTKQIRVAKLGADDKLVMRAQATTGDAGTLSYQWLFKADQEGADWVDVSTDATLKNLVKVEDVYEIAEYVVNPKSNTRLLNFRTEYFNSDKTPYTSNTVPEDTALYEKYSQCTILPAKDAGIAGTYALMAYNQIGNDENMIKERMSAKCYLPGPAPIIFDKDKPFNVTVKDNKYFITANIASDINAPAVTISWYRSGKENELGSLADVSNGFAPGWYAAKVTSNLNRKTINAVSEAKQVIYAEPAIESVEPFEGENIFELQDKETATLKVAVTVKKPDDVLEGSDESLYKNLSYKWFFKKNDAGIWKPITPSMVNSVDGNSQIVSMDKDTLVVRNIEDMTSYWYKCEVTNTLGNKSVSKELNQSKPFLVY